MPFRFLQEMSYDLQLSFAHDFLSRQTAHPIVARDFVIKNEQQEWIFQVGIQFSRRKAKFQSSFTAVLV